MIVALSCSFYMSINNVSNTSHNNLDSHLNIHESNYSNNVSNHSDDSHSHTHKHSESEKEHTHKHFNTVTFSEVLLCQSITLELNYLEISLVSPNSYDQISTEFKASELIKPPITNS